MWSATNSDSLIFINLFFYLNDEEGDAVDDDDDERNMKGGKLGTTESSASRVFDVRSGENAILISPNIHTI